MCRAFCDRSTSTPELVRIRPGATPSLLLTGCLCLVFAGACSRPTAQTATKSPVIALCSSPTGDVAAGAATVDITPPPGYPTGGHGPAGAIARGQLGRLHATALYVRDAAGKSVVLVSTDLFAMSGRIHQKRRRHRVLLALNVRRDLGGCGCEQVAGIERRLGCQHGWMDSRKDHDRPISLGGARRYKRSRVRPRADRSDRHASPSCESG